MKKAKNKKIPDEAPGAFNEIMVRYIMEISKKCLIISILFFLKVSIVAALIS